MRRKLAIAAAVTAIVVGVLVTRAIWEGRSALHDGDAAAAHGDTGAAIDLWRRAARWYVPLAPHVDDAYDRLEAAAVEADRRGQTETELAAWRGIRSSVLATRWLITPHADRLARADQRIASLMGSQPGSSGGEAFYLEQLRREDAPSLPWVVVALGGFGLWIGGCAHFVRRGLDAEDRLIRRAASASGGMVVIGLVVWVVGLYNA